MKSLKHISIILIAVLLTGTLSFVSFAQNEDGEVLEANKLNFLEILGIVDETPEYDKLLTRGEAARYLANIGKSKYGLSGAQRNYYTDVNSSTPYAAEINSLYDWKVMSGYSNGTFGPDNTITGTELMCAIMRLAGYEEIAASNGGYPQGYMKYALDLHSGLSDCSGEISTLKGLQIIYNALFIKLPKAESMTEYGEYNNIYISDTRLIEAMYNVNCREGKIVAGKRIALGGRTRTVDGKVTVLDTKLGEKLYKTPYDLEELVGVNVEYYVNKDNVIVAYLVKNNIERVSVQNNDINKVNSKLTEFTYFDANDRERKINVLQDADYVYNGTSTFDIKLSDFRNKDGHTEFIDADDDGVFELVKVWNYETYFVGQISAGEMTISDRNTNKSIKLSDDIADCEVLIRKYDSETIFDMIEEYNIVSVAESRTDTGDKLITAEVSDNVIDGTVEGTGEDYLIINGEKYNVAKNFDMAKVTLGTNGSFGLDFCDRIAAVYLKNPDGVSYAYLLGMEIEGVFEDTVSLKYMNADSEIVINEVADKFFVNGVKKTPDELKTILTDETGAIKQQLISYMTDGAGKIKKIFYSTAENQGVVPKSAEYSLVSNRTFPKNGVRFFLPSGVVDGEYYMASNLPVFKIVVDENGAVNEKVSAVVNFSTLGDENGPRLGLTIYDANEYYEPAVALMKLNVSELNTWRKAPVYGFYVTDIVQELRDDEIVKVAEGYENGIKKSYILDTDYIAEGSVQAGDLLLVFKNNDTIVEIQPIYRRHCESYSDNRLFGDYNYTFPAVIGDDANYGKSNIKSCVIGTLEKAFDTGLLIKVEGSDELRRYEINKSIGVYRETKNGKAEVLTQDALVSDEKRCMVYSRYGVVIDVIILEN